MAKTIANLNAKLTMDSRGFDVGADRTVRRSASMSRSMSGAGMKAASLNNGLAAMGVRLPFVSTALGGVSAAASMTGASYVALAASAGPAAVVLGGVMAVAIPLAAAHKALNIAIARTREQYSRIDEIAKFSRETGISTEALAAYDLAAARAGATQQDLRKGIQRMTRRVGEASRGYGEAVRGLRSLGLEVDTLIKLSPEDQFKAVADAIANQENASQRAAAAYSLFGRQGQELVGLLAEGSAGLTQAESDARRLGITFDAVSAARVEEANDAITELDASLDGVGRTLAVSTAPAITYAADELTRMVTVYTRAAARGLFKLEVLASKAGIDFGLTERMEQSAERRQAAADLEAELIEQSRLLDEAEKLRDRNLPGLDRYTQSLWAASDALDAGRISMADYAREFERLQRDQFTDAFRALDEIEAKVRNFGMSREDLQRELVVQAQIDRVGVLGPDAPDLIERYDAATKALAELNAEQDRQAEAAREAAEAQERLASIMARGEATTRRLETPSQRFRRELRDLREELAVGAISFVTFLRGAKEAAMALRDTQPKAPSARLGTVDAITAGSAEEIRMQLAAGGQDAAARLQREQVNEQKRGNRSLDTIANEITRLRVVAGVEVDI
ncbi:MAG: hypothetical protein AAGH88_11150 [Planctomycetota bacterium]